MNFIIVLLVIAVLAFSICAEPYEIRGRVFNGQNAEDSDYKFTAFLVPEEVFCCRLLRKSNTCGGVLIGPNWVLTAAHCLNGMFRVIVYLGGIVEEEVSIAYDVTKKHFIFHPYWDDENTINDIALIRIPTTAECDNIAYAQLPLQWADRLPNMFAYKIANVLGWGLRGNYGEFPDHLQRANVEVMSLKECQLIIPYITATEICVKTSKPFGSICEGDSGGPLVLEETGELIGIASFISIDGCEDGHPAVFMGITSHLPWIISVIGKMQL